MTDKELIKQEIERIEQILDDFNKTHNNTIDNGIVTAMKNICKQIKSFIDSLPEEPVSKDLDFLVISLEETIGTSPHSREVIKEHLQKAAEWGRNHFEDKSEMVSEDLEEAALKYRWEHPFCDGYTAYSFKAGAEWQKQKDQETIELAEDHAMLAGMNKMKEEMIKDAVELHIVESFNPVGTENEKPHGFTALCYNAEYPDFYPVAGQTIKVIPIKEIQR